MNKILFYLVCFFVLSATSVSGQNRVSFSYDASGNRIKKEVVLTASSVSVQSHQEYPVPEYEVAQNKSSIDSTGIDGNISLTTHNHSDNEMGTGKMSSPKLFAVNSMINEKSYSYDSVFTLINKDENENIILH